MYSTTTWSPRKGKKAATVSGDDSDVDNCREQPAKRRRRRKKEEARDADGGPTGMDHGDRDDVMHNVDESTCHKSQWIT
jgi:hypothetical protein